MVNYLALGHTLLFLVSRAAISVCSALAFGQLLRLLEHHFLVRYDNHLRYAVAYFVILTIEARYI